MTTVYGKYRFPRPPPPNSGIMLIRPYKFCTPYLHVCAKSNRTECTLSVFTFTIIIGVILPVFYPSLRLFVFAVSDCVPVTDGRLAHRVFDWRTTGQIVLGFSFTKTDKNGPTRRSCTKHAQVIESVK